MLGGILKRVKPGSITQEVVQLLQWLRRFSCMWFENILKLLHPFRPFVTEALWQSLPHREAALIVSAWSVVSLPRQTKFVKKFEKLQALTRAIRNARAEYSVEPARQISATIVSNSGVHQYISSERQVLALLSRLDLQNISFTETPPAEMQRFSKRISKAQAEYDGLMASLKSPNFVEKSVGFGRKLQKQTRSLLNSKTPCFSPIHSVGIKLNSLKSNLDNTKQRACVQTGSPNPRRMDRMH